MTKKEKTYVEDMDRGIYDIKNAFEYRYKTSKGLNEEIVREISEEKNEPKWMLDYRLKALEIFNNSKNPVWGPDLSDVNIEDITTYIRPKADLSTSWEDLPEDIRNTFDKLGIPEAEKKQFLSGVGAQYDSEVVYHSIQKYLRDQGVIYTVYVPEGVNVDIPLQSYFRLNAPGAGQFEHTLIILEKNSYCHFIEGCSAPRYNVVNLHAGAVELFVADNSTLRYSTIENWSRNMYNLNTKRAIVEKNGKIQWISGSFGSKVSMLYPTSVLKGEGSTSEFTGISFAGAGQNLDTGAQVVHLAPNTNSFIDTKSISKNGGIAVYRGLVEFSEDAKNSKNTTSCESLMLDEDSRSDTIPTIRLKNSEVDVGHEAKIGKISDQVIFYLMTRGLSEEDARQLVVRGFAEPVAKELPMEYAVEMNNLINLELVGSIG